MAKTTTAPATPQTPEFDWKGYLMLARTALDRKFEAHDIDSDPMLLSVAKFYLASDLPAKISHAGIKTFVQDVAYKGKRYGLTSGQVKGVLNVAVGQVNALEGQEEGRPAWDGKRVIENGIFTIVLDGLAPEESNEWVTLKVDDDFRDTAPEGAQMISILTGPDNTRNYSGIGFLQGSNLMVWGKNRGRTEWIEKAEMLLDLAKSDPLMKNQREAYAMISGRCSRCRKTLTVPKSIEYGVGPECRKILGL